MPENGGNYTNTKLTWGTTEVKDFYDALWDAIKASIRLDLREIMRANGYVIIHAGEGRIAWEKTLLDGRKATITARDGYLDDDPEEKRWYYFVTILGVEGHVRGNFGEPCTLIEALEAADRPPPMPLGMIPGGERLIAELITCDVLVH